MTTLFMYTVYDHPLDYPDKYVVRRYAVTASGPVAGDVVMVNDSLDAIRAVMEKRGLYCLTRHPEDDSKIVETWL